MKLAWAAANLIAVIWLLSADQVNLFAVVFLLWLNLLCYAMSRVSERSFLLGFLLSFGLFLLSQDIMERLFDYAPVSLAVQAERGVFGMMILSLVGVGVGYIFLHGITRLWRSTRAVLPSHTSLPGRGGIRGRAPLGEHAQFISSVRRGSEVVFWAALPLAFVGTMSTVLTRSVDSYADIYTAEYTSTRGAMAILTQFASQATTASVSIYLATMPSLRRGRSILVAWLALNGLVVLTGRRRELAVVLLFIFCYALARRRITPRDPWMTRRGMSLWAVTIPIVMLFFGALESLRGVGGAKGDSLASFLYGQGVSVRVLENVALYGYLLPHQRYLLEFAHQGLPARLLGIPVLQGNTVERVEAGGSLSHSLSYIVLGPEAYLSGLGTGTSFVAEAFADYGFTGALLAGVVCGLLLALVDSLDAGRFLASSLGLMVAQSLLWAPRGSSTLFLSTLLAPITLLTLLAIALLSLFARGTQHTEPRPPTRDHPDAHPSPAKDITV